MHHPHTFNPNHLDEAAVTHALATGEHEQVLQAYFGPAHAELSALAQQALATTPQRHAPRVLLLPGLLGSRLIARTRRSNELLWLDPAIVQTGRLTSLTLGRRRSIRPVGMMLPGYLKLKLHLQAAGFDVQVFAYDWRRSIVQLGALLAEELQHGPHREVMLVAHSMGGLVARAALRHPASQCVSKLIQIGTPNQGSYALLQALRGVYPTVRKLAAVDHEHDAAQLTRAVFQSFPSFFEMLPHPAHTPGLNLFDTQHWPDDVLSPPKPRLQQARRLPRHLAPADQRCHVIVGTGQDTVTGVRREHGQFVFQTSAAGDGTVPEALAHWPQAQHWYLCEQHGLLPRNSQVAQAVIELLNGDATATLARTSPASVSITGERHESQLQSLSGCKIRWDQLPLQERRELLEPQISSVFTLACG